MEAPRYPATATEAVDAMRVRDDPPDTIPIQPRPVMVRVVHFKLFRWWVTAIMRHWNPGDSGPKGRCRLCRECMAYGDGCLTVIGGKVPVDEAALVSISGKMVQGGT